MKNNLLHSVIFISLVAWLVLPGLVQAETDLPRQDINISFNVTNSLLTGQSVITLPANVPLRISLGDLQHVQITRQHNNQQLSVPMQGKNSIILSPQPQVQTIQISWQMAAAGSGRGSGNLISSKGITLTGFWHPITDHNMLYSLTAHLPAGFSGVSEGDKITLINQKKGHILKTASRQPLRAINFAAGIYSISSRRVGSTTVFSYFFPEDAGLSADYLNKAAKYIKRYEKMIGPFPYKRYSIVENRLPTGYGMPGFTMLGQAVIRLPFIKDTSLGHEILHSWFGNAVQTDNTGNWCEGLTTYLGDQSYEADKGAGRQYRKNQLLRYHSYVHAGNITALIDFQHGGDSQPMAKKMRVIGYDKGSMVFHMLRKEIGDEYFYAGLRALYVDNKFTRIGWTDIEMQFSQTAGRDLSPFFGQWLLRRDVPRLAVKTMDVEQSKGKSVLSFTLVQKNEAPYLLQVPVVVQTLTGGEIRKTFEVSSLQQQISVTTDSLPIVLRIDPNYDLMRQLTFEENAPTWTQFLGATQKTVVLPAKKDMELYMPLIANLERSGCELVTTAELKNSALGKGSFVFLGSSSHTRGLFAGTQHPDKGFSLDVHPSPLAEGQVMVLVSSSSTRETTKVVRKLSHYGKYSYLHFAGGKIRQKRITPSADGIVLPLLTPPSGIPVKRVEKFSTIMDDLRKSRIIYVGEMHTAYSSHVLQLQIIQALYADNPNLMIGMEMFPRTSQAALDDYINGTVTDEREFLKYSHYFKVWGYDYRMYRDIIGYAKAHSIPIIGLNLDKQIVSTVFKTGATDTLTAEQLEDMAAERDLELPGYRQRLRDVHNLHDRQPESSKAGFSGFLQAQSMWDETMAESIVMALHNNPDKKMVVIAGTGHVYKDSAIPPRVTRRMTVRQSVIAADNGVDRGLEEGKRLDYLMFMPPMQLPPAGKIGVMLNEIKATDDAPARVEIIQVSPHGKAGKAGIKAKDIIVAIDDFPVTTVGELKAGLLDKDPGDTVTITIKRGDTTQNIAVELSNMKKSAMMMPPGHPKK